MKHIIMKEEIRVGTKVRANILGSDIYTVKHIYNNGMVDLQSPRYKKGYMTISHHELTPA
jgi:hypothetical protein